MSNRGTRRQSSLVTSDYRLFKADFLRSLVNSKQPFSFDQPDPSGPLGINSLGFTIHTILYSFVCPSFLSFCPLTNLPFLPRPPLTPSTSGFLPLLSCFTLLYAEMAYFDASHTEKAVHSGCAAVGLISQIVDVNFAEMDVILSVFWRTIARFLLGEAKRLRRAGEDEGESVALIEEIEVWEGAGSADYTWLCFRRGIERGGRGGTSAEHEEDGGALGDRVSLALLFAPARSSRR